MFKDVNGKLSSKRINAFICICSAVVMGILSVILKLDIITTVPFLTTGAALLGVSVFEKKDE